MADLGISEKLSAEYTSELALKREARSNFKLFTSSLSTATTNTLKTNIEVDRQMNPSLAG